MFEYLFNNDTQDIGNRVSEWAQKDEPALSAHCQEVSRQTDTSSLAVQRECVAKGNAAKAVLTAMGEIIKELLGALSSSREVFHAQNAKENFPTVCRAIIKIEEERQMLLSCISDLTYARREVAKEVAKVNSVLHFLSIAGRAAKDDARTKYTQAAALTESAHAHLKKCDTDLCELQKFCMTFVEGQLSVFVRELRGAADFNHAGEALDKPRIRALCGEVLLLINRCPNITF